MFKQFNFHHWNVDGQDGDSSSLTDQSNGQYSFDPFGQIGPDAQSWSPPLTGMGAGSFAHFGWGVGSTPTSTSSADSGSPSGSASGSSGSLGGSFASGGSSPSGSAGGGTTTVSTPGSNLIFVNTYGSGCTAQFEACIVDAEKQLENLFTNSVTLQITFTEQDSPGSGFLLTNGWNWASPISYSTLKSKLQSVTSDVLPASNPAPGNWSLPEAYARMLGLSSSTPSVDDTVTLNTAYSWDYGQDVIDGVIHELTEGAMGRVGGLGDQNSAWSTMDLFRYTSSGTPDYTDGRDGATTYFSSDGGSTLSNANLPNKGAPTLTYNNEYSGSTKVNGGDTADWNDPAVFGYGYTGEIFTLDQTELDVMKALGWTLSLKQDVDGTSGSWETPADWSAGSMPVEAQDAYITGAGVTLNSNVIVNSIGTSSGGILEIGDSSATSVVAVEGTTLNSLTTSYTGVGNNGDTLVYDGSSLQMGDILAVTYDNAGTLGVGDKGAGGTGYLYIASTVDFDGGGTVVLGAGSGYYGDIVAAPGTTTSEDGIDNVNNTIEGNGYINLGSITNSGVIEALTGTLTVSTVNGIDDSGGWLEATSGGSVLQLESVVSGSGGYVYAGSGGTVDIWSSVGSGIDAYVAYGGVENVESGGSTNYGVVYGLATTSAGAFNSSTYIESGGIQYVYGSSYYGAIELYGNQYVESGGEAYGTVDYWNQFVSAGAVTSYVSALSAGDQYVSSGATADYTTLSAGGQQWVYSGGVGWEAFVYSGGDQEVELGGTADYTQVYAGGVQHNYGSSYAADVYGSAYTYAGGVDTYTYIGSGGVQSTFGSSYYADIALYGIQYVESGGYTSGSYDYWDQFVYSGGVTDYTSALSAGDQYVSSGGTADFTVLSAGGQQWIYTGGLGYEAFVYSGGDQEVEPGGTAEYTQVYSGGLQHNYGSSTSASIYSGGVAYTYAGGVDSSTYIGNGGVQSVYGSSYNASIDSGGSQTVESGGLATSASEYDYGSGGGVQYVSSGGLAQYTYDDWLQDVWAGGEADYTSVYADGWQTVYGYAYDTVVSGAGAVFYATQYVDSGGEANLAYVKSGGIQYVSSGGTAYSTYLYSGGSQTVYLGGAAYDDVVSSGGVENDYGLTSGGAVSSGGNETVELGGVDSSTTILKAGKQTVYAGGSAYYDTVSSGGTQYDSGFAFSTTIVKGGVAERALRRL